MQFLIVCRKVTPFLEEVAIPTSQKLPTYTPTIIPNLIYMYVHTLDLGTVLTNQKLVVQFTQQTLANVEMCKLWRMESCSSTQDFFEIYWQCGN
jgi:hypothetical protein